MTRHYAALALLVLPLSLAAKSADTRLAATFGAASRPAQVEAVRGAVRAGQIAHAEALLALTAEEVLAWTDAAESLGSAAKAHTHDREALAEWMKAPGKAPVPGLRWPYDEAMRALGGDSKAGPTGVQQSLALAALHDRKRQVHGSLDVRTAAGLVALAVGNARVAPGLGWASALDPDATAWLRSQLLSQRHLDDTALGRAVGRAVGLGGVYMKPLVQGIIDAPELTAADAGRDRRDAIIRAMIRELASLDYSAPHSWKSLYVSTVKPLLLHFLDGEALEPQRAAATFAVWRAEALGSMDDLGREVAQMALTRNAARLTFVGEAHQLHRQSPAVAAELLKMAGAEPARFDAEGPWNLRDRAWAVAQEHCGPLDRPQDEAPPEEPDDTEDPKLEEMRKVVREGTGRILELIAAHTGPLSQSLSYRRCEAWMRRRDIERAGGPEQRRANEESVSCLGTHVEQFPEHDAARLEYARLLDDAGQPLESRKQLVRLVDAADERSRILGSYRLLGHIEPEGEHLDDARLVTRELAGRAAALVAARGFNPHQRTYAALVQAWLDATGGRAKEAMRRLAALLADVTNPKDGSVTFANAGGLMDYASKVSILAETPASDMLRLYAPFPLPVRQSALVQLAHLYVRADRPRDIDRIADALGTTALPPEGRLLLIDARLREYGPRSADEESGSRPVFDAVSARSALAQLTALESMASGVGKDLQIAARCVFLSYAEAVAVTLAETNQSADAAALLGRALAVAGPDGRVALLIRLADVEERLGKDREALDLYRMLLDQHPETARQKPLVVVDYYQAAFRLRSVEDRGRAGGLLAQNVEAIVKAAFAEYPAGKDRDLVLDVVREALAFEKRWKALLAVSETIGLLGEYDAARRACYAGYGGLTVEHLERAGLRQHFEKPGGRPADGPAACAAAVRRAGSPAAEAALADALAAAEKALSCAPDLEAQTDLRLVLAEGRRLLGKLGPAGEALEQARLDGGRHEAVAEAARALAWSALLAGELDRAEPLFATAGGPEAVLFAGHIALARGHASEAAKHFGTAAAQSSDPELRIWEARALLRSGHVEAWKERLLELASRGPDLHGLVIAEIDVQAAAQPDAAEKLLSRLRKTSHAAKARLALAKAREHLERKILPLSSKRFKSTAQVLGAHGKLGRQLVRLLGILKPALSAPRKGQADAEALVQSLDVVVSGLEAVRGFLTAHEERLSSSRRRGRQVAESLDELERQAIGLGQAALGAAKQQAFVSPTLRQLAARVARRYPDDFGATRSWAFPCEDEIPSHLAPLGADPVAAAVGRLLQARQAGLASLLAGVCAPASASSSADWAALRYAALRADPAGAPPGVVARAAANLAGHASKGAGLSESVRLALALHFAGVDCERTAALLQESDPMAPGVPAAVRRAAAACSEDKERLGAVLASEAATGARALRRHADYVSAFATTVEDASKVTSMLEAAARQAGISLEAVQDAPICELPVAPAAPAGG